MPEKIERRAATIQASGDSFQIVARAVTYNALSKPNIPWAGCRERIAPGCFRASIERGDEVVASFNHDASQVLGRTRNKTLKLSDAGEGLDFTVQLNPDSQAHKDLFALVKAGTLSECSFAFIAETDDWSDAQNGTGQSYQLRTITKAKLLDVSVVTTPAYNDTQASARSITEKAEATEVDSLREKLNAVSLF